MCQSRPNMQCTFSAEFFCRFCQIVTYIHTTFMSFVSNFWTWHTMFTNHIEWVCYNYFVLQCMSGSKTHPLFESSLKENICCWIDEWSSWWKSSHTIKLEWICYIYADLNTLPNHTVFGLFRSIPLALLETLILAVCHCKQKAH